jgi:hypothetical protein
MHCSQRGWLAEMLVYEPGVINTGNRLKFPWLLDIPGGFVLAWEPSFPLANGFSETLAYGLDRSGGSGYNLSPSQPAS